jgi:hypothetical protein
MCLVVSWFVQIVQDLQMFRFSNLKNVQNTESYRQSRSTLSDELTGRSKSTCVRNWGHLSTHALENKVKFITQLFKNTSIVFSFKTGNTFLKNTNNKKRRKDIIQSKWNIPVKLLWLPQVVHRTSRCRLSTRFMEHTCFIKTIDATVTLSNSCWKETLTTGTYKQNGYIAYCRAKHVNTAEKFYIYDIRKKYQ